MYLDDGTVFNDLKFSEELDAASSPMGEQRTSASLSSLQASLRKLHRESHPPLQFVSMLRFLDYLARLRVPTLFGRISIPQVIIGCSKFLFGLHLFVAYFGHFSETAGPSMLSTLNVEGDYVWINKLYRRGKGIVVGDLVTVKHPWYPEVRASKRVLGMPGDFVLRNTPGEGSAMIQVPEGHCWLGGDNLPASRDSRDYGPLPLATIRGKVTARVLPWSEAKWLENPLRPVTS